MWRCGVRPHVSAAQKERRTITACISLTPCWGTQLLSESDYKIDLSIAGNAAVDSLITYRSRLDGTVHLVRRLQLPTMPDVNHKPQK